MDMTQNKCCRHGASLRRRRRRCRKILRSIIFSCSIIAVAVGNRMIRSVMAGQINMMLKPEIIHMIMLL